MFETNSRGKETYEANTCGRTIALAAFRPNGVSYKLALHVPLRLSRANRRAREYQWNRENRVRERIPLALQVHIGIGVR